MQIPSDPSLDKTQRIKELLLVLAVAFLGGIAVSLYVLVTGATISGSSFGEGGSSFWALEKSGE